MRAARASFLGLVLASCALPDVAEYAAGGRTAADDARDAAASTDAASPDGAGDTGIRPDSSSGGPTDTGGIDAPAPKRCVDRTGAVFCADFDSDPFDSGFVRVVAGGAIAAESALFLSPGRSLSATLPARASGQPRAGLERTFPRVLGSFRLSWAFQVETTGDQGAVDVGGVHRTEPYHTIHLRFRRTGDSGGLEIIEYASATDSTPEHVKFTALGRGPKPVGFTHVALEVRTANESSSLTVLLDGVVVNEAVPLVAHRSVGRQVAMAGISGSDGGGAAIKVNVEDFLLEAL